MIWTPLAFIWYVMYAFLIIKTNAGGGHWFWIAWLCGAAPLWLCTSHFSKNLLFDGMLYDMLMFLGYAFGTLYFTEKLTSFTSLQWTGVAMIVVGMCLVKAK